MEEYIAQLVDSLTLEEKIGMIHGAGLFRTAGVERLGIPPLHFSDGTCGVRGEYPDDLWEYVGDGSDIVSYLPCGSAVASTWNRQLARLTGSVLGEEARGRGKDVLLGPGLNIKRTPLCGRNFEYLSEDPYLAGEMGAELVQGIQSHDVAACAKHFAANGQETNRLWVETIVDEKTLAELYFPAFKTAVDKGGLLSIMGAYNLLNGEHCCTSKALLNGTLREKWGYDGLIVSDWGGVHDTVLATESALDVEMDVTYDFEGHYMAKALLNKIRSGELPESLVDEKVKNILRLMVRLKMIGSDKQARDRGAYSTQDHHQAALEVARESVILLKNEGNLLPLDEKKIKTLAVIGGNAVATHAFGGGSAEVKALYEITPLLGIKKLLGGNVQVHYLPGYGVPVMGGRPETSWQAASTSGAGGERPKEPTLTKDNKEAAVALAKSCDAVVYIGGLNHDYDVEGLDRESMKLPYGQDELIEALLQARPDTVVVLLAGSPVEMPWLSKVQSLVWSYYAGMEGGTALAEVLFGKVNPSGRLAETMLLSADYCPFKIHPERVELTEGNVGYRYYNRHHNGNGETPVNFCFGHGLSYSEFVYSDLKIQGREAPFEVSFAVKNVSNVAGKETVQLYLQDVQWTGAQKLRRFEKVELNGQEEKRVTFYLADEDFSVYDANKKDFVLQKGTYNVQIGASSRDIRLDERIQIW